MKKSLAIFAESLRRHPLWWGRYALFFLVATAPLWAQDAGLPSATNNVIVKTALFITKIAFYGFGGLVFFWGVIISVWTHVFKSERFQGQSGMSRMFWGVGLFAVPSVLELIRDWFNNQDGSQNSLDKVIIDLEEI